MKNKNKINEDDKFEVGVTKDELKDPQTAKELAQIQKQNKNVKIILTKDKPTSSSSSMAMYETEGVIEPQDKETIKYLSNVMDPDTNKVSQPFVIGGKNYQMIRGINQNKEIVSGVYCLDDLDDNGENIIHSVEFFEESIVKPVMELEKQNQSPIEEVDGESNADLINYLNLKDVSGYKHFFVNINTGDVVAKFHNYREMITSGIKLGPEEDYMNAKQLKAFRAGEYFKQGFNKNEIEEDINIEKLKGDVKILVSKISNMFGKYFAKLDTPAEQSVFLAKMGQLVNVPVEKLPQIISSYKELAKDDPSEAPLTGDNTQPTNESVKTKNVIKTIKVKDIK